MGESISATLQEAAHTSANSDMRMFATSLAIQMRAGGNIADLMERLAAVIRERKRLNRRVRVLTAQTQLSKRILIAMPFVLFIAVNMLNPDYMRPLYSTSSGKLLLGIAVTSIAVGSYIMNRMAATTH